MEYTFKEEIKGRTKKIGLEVIKLIEELPQKPASWILSKQILRSATAIGSSYRAACRAKSKPDFINKLKIVEEETDETIYWLEILQEAELVSKNRIAKLTFETAEILALVVSAIKTTRDRYGLN